VQLADLYNPRKLSLELDGPSGRRRYGVKIPPGTRDGDRIRLAGQGMPGRGGAPGDLYLTVRVAPDPRFAVEGDDLVVELPVDAWDAALGARLPVPTLDGEVQLTLPQGLSSGRRLRLRGKGLPRRTGGRGDLFARIRIVVPQQLTPEQEQLFVRLRAVSAASRGDPSDN
jgi:curved DNA-binding protein